MRIRCPGSRVPVAGSNASCTAASAPSALPTPIAISLGCVSTRDTWAHGAICNRSCRNDVGAGAEYHGGTCRQLSGQTGTERLQASRAAFESGIKRNESRAVGVMHVRALSAPQDRRSSHLLRSLHLHGPPTRSNHARRLEGRLAGQSSARQGCCLAHHCCGSHRCNVDGTCNDRNKPRIDNRQSGWAREQSSRAAEKLGVSTESPAQYGIPYRPSTSVAAVLLAVN